MIENEYTLNIKYDERASVLVVNNTFVLNIEEKFSAEDIETLKSLPTGEYHFDFYFGSYKNYQLGEVKSGDFSFNYLDTGLELSYKGVDLIFIRKYRVTRLDTVYFSLDDNEHTYIIGKYGLNKSELNVNQNILIYTIAFDYLSLLGSAFIYSMIERK